MLLKVNGFEVEIVIRPRTPDYCLFLHVPRLFELYWDNHLGRHFDWLKEGRRSEVADDDDEYEEEERAMTPKERALDAWKVHPRIIINNSNKGRAI